MYDTNAAIGLTELPGEKADRVLLEGPHSRRKELWLVLRAVRDFIAGFRTLHFVGPCVTVFGSRGTGRDTRITQSRVTWAAVWRSWDSR